MIYTLSMILIGLVSIVFLVFFIKFFSLWFRALLSGAHISLARLIGMWIRRVKSTVIVDSRIMLVKAGLP
ncbi:MAG: flotillin-like FloA family protein, partial [Spirochaetales bacterium]|nr:flotillin-like FloA family protein [Spirochaetales bacterium]